MRARRRRCAAPASAPSSPRRPPPAERAPMIHAVALCITLPTCGAPTSSFSRLLQGPADLCSWGWRKLTVHIISGVTTGSHASLKHRQVDDGRTFVLRAVLVRHSTCSLLTCLLQAPVPGIQKVL